MFILVLMIFGFSSNKKDRREQHISLIPLMQLFKVTTQVYWTTFKTEISWETKLY